VIYIDTGGLIARYLSRDQYHHRAIEGWEFIRNRQYTCLTSNFVLDEVFTLLGRRGGHAFAAERAQNIYASNRIKILRPGHEEELKALDWFQKFSDQKVSFTDCISFVLMKKAHIKKVFSFDIHFRLAGFDLMP
jgi:predicted nucleic acid-binding protein